MKSYIKAIMIFNKSGELRKVSMEQGINIIAGESKTGKSALVEIIDYCLCSSRCTIPKGKITDFSYLFVMPMFINQNTYVIARLNWQNGSKMYVLKESANFSIDDINLAYFNDKPQLTTKNAQYEIEAALGLYVTNTVTDDEKQRKKASLRNMVSYSFQHQNLMASKFALFYRFSDFYKRKDIIEQFPVFAGMIEQEYYSSLIELGSLKAQLKKKLKIQQSNKKGSSYVEENLLPALKDYHALIGIPFDSNITTKKMFTLASNLPEFDDSQLFNKNDISERYHNLNNKLEELRVQESDVLSKLDNLGNVTKSGSGFTDMLQELKNQTSISDISVEEYSCPLCGNKCEEISNDDAALLEATSWLDNELEITDKYTSDFSEDIRKLKEVHREIENAIKNIWREIKNIEKNFINSKNLISKREQINYAKANIIFYSDIANSDILESVDEDINDLKNRILNLEEKISGFDLETKKLKAQAFISDNMNRLSITLDFENEYRPVNLNFDLVDGTFDLYQHQKKYEKIFLYEMGSGANWVSCHIALFLSFLRYFATQQQSPMPLIMFFDQPSQVYFPQSTSGNKDDPKLSHTDLEAVNKMYKTVFDEINSIGKDTGNLPQMILVDHVDGKDLEIKDEFESYVRAEWRNGKALI